MGLTSEYVPARDRTVDMRALQMIKVDASMFHVVTHRALSDAMGRGIRKSPSTVIKSFRSLQRLKAYVRKEAKDSLAGDATGLKATKKLQDTLADADAEMTCFSEDASDIDQLLKETTQVCVCFPRAQHPQLVLSSYAREARACKH